jgi:hypothetical protein
LAATTNAAFRESGNLDFEEGNPWRGVGTWATAQMSPARVTAISIAIMLALEAIKYRPSGPMSNMWGSFTISRADHQTLIGTNCGELTRQTNLSWLSPRK